MHDLDQQPFEGYEFPELSPHHPIMKDSAVPLRVMLRGLYGAGKYRITCDGSIHAYGVMPQTSIKDWYFVGFEDAPLTMAYLHRRYAAT